MSGLIPLSVLVLPAVAEFYKLIKKIFLANFASRLFVIYLTIGQGGKLC